jgi:hypothetical protein
MGMESCRTDGVVSHQRIDVAAAVPVRRRGRWWARVRGTFTRTSAYLTSTVLPWRPRGDEEGRGMAFSPPRIPAHVARGAASEEGERGCSSFSARALFSCLSILLFVLCAWLALHPHRCVFSVLKILWI